MSLKPKSKPFTKLKTFMFIFAITSLIWDMVGCAHLSDTCDSYCFRNGGQCSGVEYGTRRYNTKNGETQDRPTYFHCKFVN